MSRVLLHTLSSILFNEVSHYVHHYKLPQTKAFSSGICGDSCKSIQILTHMLQDCPWASQLWESQLRFTCRMEPLSCSRGHGKTPWQSTDLQGSCIHWDLIHPFWRKVSKYSSYPRRTKSKSHFLFWYQSPFSFVLNTNISLETCSSWKILSFVETNVLTQSCSPVLVNLFSQRNTCPTWNILTLKMLGSIDDQKIVMNNC